MCKRASVTVIHQATCPLPHACIARTRSPSRPGCCMAAVCEDAVLWSGHGEEDAQGKNRAANEVAECPFVDIDCDVAGNYIIYFIITCQ